MDVAARVGQVGRQSDGSKWMDHAVRVGLVSYGVVHLIIAWLAVQLAFGDNSGSASGQGALHQLAGNTLGRVSLWVAIFGFLALVVWQAMEAIWGNRDARGEQQAGKRVGSAAKVVVYGALAYSAFKTVTSGSSGGGGTDGLTAKLMKLPAGPLLVGLVGVVVIGIAGYLAWHGLTEKFREQMSGKGQTGRDGKAYVTFAKAGYVAKGLALAIVGVLFVYAAVTHDPNKSGGLDQALHKLLQQPFGSVVLVAVAAGLACFGLFCFAWAKHLDR